ncbi:hypothetical protein SprV_0501936600 [Sparganum proliferum]
MSLWRGRTSLWATIFVGSEERLEFSNGLRGLRRRRCARLGDVDEEIHPTGRPTACRRSLVSTMPKRSSNQPADQRRARRSFVTMVSAQCSIRPSIQQSPQYPVRAAQRAPEVTTLTWFSPPVEAVALCVAAEQSPATWSHWCELGASK